MGSSASEQNIKTDYSSWQQYEVEIDKDKKSDIEPYTQKELEYLQELFNQLDKKNVKSLEIKDFEGVSYLRDHPLFPRIRDIFEEQMKKIKAKRINFELFLFLLSTFHIKTEIQNKYKYIFRLYDCDKNTKIDQNDLTKIYKLIYNNESWMQEQDYSKLVTQTLIRYGTKGQIKIEHIREMIPQYQVKQLLSFRFNKIFL